MSSQKNLINRRTVDDILRIDSFNLNGIASRLTQVEESMATVDGSGAVSGSDFVFDGAELNAVIGSSIDSTANYTYGSSVLDWVGSDFNINSVVDHLTLIYRNLTIKNAFNGSTISS